MVGTIGGATASCALAMGVVSEVLNFRAEGSCDGCATPWVRVDRGRGTSVRARRRHRPRYCAQTQQEALEAIPRQARTHSALGRRGAPGGGPGLIIGTGAHGSLPIMPEVAAEAGAPKRRACRCPDGTSLPADHGPQATRGLRGPSRHLLIQRSGARRISSRRVTGKAGDSDEQRLHR